MTEAEGAFLDALAPGQAFTLGDLVDADARRPLNHSQRMLRDKAEEAFITEIGAALELSPEDAQEKVGGILSSRIDRE